ncbi:hypothetical protein RJ639_037804 [Escallonia herrerae]|uniref:Late embryogenesis abundant protein LEA-2 subgroup domain-containing protein n=1 Tax=Escallonia herrerae TaxID=1293975 RepID=A0AA88WJJ4_9ASTE|nr:hypothetical protein RJ639_037804 [Escallonia herrerae]
MASPKPTNDPSYYYPLPQDPHPHQPPQTYVVLPLLRLPSLNRSKCRRRVVAAALLLLLAGAVYVLWPSDPDLKVVRLYLDRVHIRTSPHIALDIKLDLTIKVRNPDLYSMDYRSLVVSIGYRGKELGFVSSSRGHIRPRGASYVDATLELNGVEVLSDVFLLLEDLARGSIPFDTVTEVRGRLGLFFFQLPLEVYSSNVNLLLASDEFGRHMEIPGLLVYVSRGFGYVKPGSSSIVNIPVIDV